MVENRPGAGGNIGAEHIARAAPDGHALLVAASSLVTAPFLVANLPFDPMRDFAPIAEVAQYPMVVLAHPSVPVRTLAEVVALAKARPGALAFSSAGVGNTSHLAPALFAHMADRADPRAVRRHRPFPGGSARGPGADLLQQPDAVGARRARRPVPRARRHRRHALARPARRADCGRAGLRQLRSISWIGILAAAATPEPVAARLEADILAAMREAEIRARMEAAGFEPLGRGRGAFRRVMEADSALWGGFIREAGIRVD